MKSYLMKNGLLLVIAMVFGCASGRSKNTNVDDFVPKGYVLFDKSFGDLNNDGLEDCVLIIKGTDNDIIVTNRFDKKVDRNRRGIIVLFKNQNTYQLAAANYDCFSSENEDGGVYYSPQLSIDIEHGDLYIKYAHGRYGNWSYSFRYNNSNFELIAYDATHGGAVISSEVNINFLSKKKRVNKNINENADGGDEVFKETLIDIEIEQLLELSEIKTFDALDMSKK